MPRQFAHSPMELPMTDAGPASRIMLMRRLELVGQACQINAQLQRLQQAQAGLDFEMQRCELALEAGLEEAAAAMGEAERAAHKIRRDRMKLELEMDAVEAEIKEIDGFFGGLPKGS